MSRIGLTIKSTELRPGEVMDGGTVAGEPCWLWSPSEGTGWHLTPGRADVPWGVDGWPLAGRHDGVFTGTIIAVDVPADAEALARVCRGESAVPSGGIECATDNHPPASDAGAGVVAPSDDALIAALRAHPDPLGLLGRAKIATRWGEAGAMLCRYDVGSGTPIAYSPHDAAECRSEDARLLADGWRLL